MVASRRVWQGVEFGLVGLVGLLLVLGVRIVVQTAVVQVPALDPDATPTPVAVVQPLEAYAVISDRNIFATGTTAAATPAVILRGVGLYAGETRAVVEDATTHEQRLVRVGDPLGDGRVAAITWDRLTLHRDGADVSLALAPPDGETVRDAVAPTTAPPAPPAGIRRTGANAFIVDRRTLGTALDGMSGLMTQLRAVPEIEDGRPIGFRMFEVSDRSLFTDLGLQSGDVVQRVNGTAVTDPAALLGFLKQLRTEPRVALDIVRAGAPRTLVYDLR